MNTMIYTVHNMNGSEKEDAVTLEILQTIENKNDVTQRHIADDLGIALGLANSYLKRCVRKGLIKIHQAPANRYLYYLTPSGFSEKSRLTGKYLSTSFDFYRKAGNSFRQVFKHSKQKSWKNILFCGISELSEIASLRISEFGLEHVATYEPGSDLKEFLGKPVWSSLGNTYDVDAYLITSLNSPNKMHQGVISSVDKNRVLVPEILGLNI